MCRNATSRLLPAALAVCALPGLLPAQAPELTLEWRRIGNTAIDLALPALATGPIPRIWYSPSGDALFAQFRNGQIWQTRDFETWKPSTLRDAPIKFTVANAATRPEAAARVEQAASSPTRYYAQGRFVYRSDDGGAVWTNVTGHRNQSILGEGLTDLAVSPRDPDEITASGQFGLWRSLDGGSTWTGLNSGLPNLPAKKFLALPNGLRATRLSTDSNPALDIEWAPGERAAWRATDSSASETALQLRQQITQQLGASIETAISQGDWIYAGSSDGRIFTSNDRGQTFQPFNFTASGVIQAIWVDPKDPRIAVAGIALSGTPGPPIVRTANGGRDWNDASDNLPPVTVFGVTADAASGFLYAATSQGVFATMTDLANLTPTSGWQRISAGLPAVPALDVRLDDNSNQLFTLLEGYGVFATMAPHRLRELSIVNAADFSDRPAAPGSLLSILGRRLSRVRSGALNVPVVGASNAETQIQVPFEAQGDTLSLTLDQSGFAQSVGFPLAPVSPAVFIDRDGAPLLLEADSGVALDAMTPAKSGARVQILTTGMGAVTPAWPTGAPAPAGNTPKINAPVRVYLDREPLEVTRATLAPGYIGFYLIEVQLPQIVNAGPAELYVEAGNKQSNRVRLYLAP